MIVRLISRRTALEYISACGITIKISQSIKNIYVTIITPLQGSGLRHSNFSYAILRWQLTTKPYPDGPTFMLCFETLRGGHAHFPLKISKKYIENSKSSPQR